MRQIKQLSCAIILIGGLLAAAAAQTINQNSSARGELQKFHDWWAYEPPAMSEKMPYTQLKSFAEPLALPNNLKSESFERLILHQTPKITLVLAVPKESDASAKSEAERQKLFDRCSNNRSYLIIVPSNSISPIDLNPYCSTAYGTDEVDFQLYWLSNGGESTDEQMPHISVTTNAPACVPSQLYSYDRRKNRFVLAKEKCGG